VLVAVVERWRDGWDAARYLSLSHTHTHTLSLSLSLYSMVTYKGAAHKGGPNIWGFLSPSPPTFVVGKIYLQYTGAHRGGPNGEPGSTVVMTAPVFEPSTNMGGSIT